MTEKKLIKKSIRVDIKQLEELNKVLGLNDDSKNIRAAMNFTVNVAHNLFSGSLSNMFKRKKGNEEIDRYEPVI